MRPVSPRPKRTRMGAGTTSLVFATRPGTFSGLCLIRIGLGMAASVVRMVCNYLNPWRILCYRSRHDSYPYALAGAPTWFVGRRVRTHQSGLVTRTNYYQVQALL